MKNILVCLSLFLLVAANAQAQRLQAQQLQAQQEEIELDKIFSELDGTSPIAANSDRVYVAPCDEGNPAGVRGVAACELVPLSNGYVLCYQTGPWACPFFTTCAFKGVTDENGEEWAQCGCNHFTLSHEPPAVLY